jgi:hypothetical protein
VLNFGFEHRKQPLAPTSIFVRRMVSSGVAAGLIIAVSWVAGALLYHYVAGIHGWIDSFYNAAMILGGMGPVDVIERPVGKIFASLYALYSGIMLLTSAGIFLSPLMHRLMHRLHLETKGS